MDYSSHFYRRGSTMNNGVVIFGAGGHGVVVADTIRAMLAQKPLRFEEGFDDPARDYVIGAALIEKTPDVKILGYSDPFKEKGTLIVGFPVLGNDAEALEPIDVPEGTSEAASFYFKATHYAIGLGGVRGGEGKREAIYRQCSSYFLRPCPVRHPTSWISSEAEIGEATAVLAGVIVQARAKVGVNVILNTRCSIDHDCVIGDHSHIAPGATLSGNVHVGRDSMIGVGATVIQGARIGDGATVGAGAVVVRDVPDGATVVGCPARISE